LEKSSREYEMAGAIRILAIINGKAYRNSFGTSKTTIKWISHYGYHD
jgi:hypothetical protein